MHDFPGQQGLWSVVKNMLDGFPAANRQMLFGAGMASLVYWDGDSFQGWKRHRTHIDRLVGLWVGKCAMCLSYPGRVIQISGNLASVDFGKGGVRERINIAMVEARIGSYVLVQGGFAIKVLSEREADEALEMWRMVEELNMPAEGVL